MKDLGVISEFTEKGLKLSKTSHRVKVDIHFSDIPDLAQTVAVVCAVKGIYAHMTGLESLRIKETNRIEALQHELSKLNSQLIEKNHGEWELIPVGKDNIPENLVIRTYDDHRMAMAFAPLATRTDLHIENPSVVEKSYPTFWDDMIKAGFKVEFQQQ